MFIEKNREGYWVITDFIGDERVKRMYLYHTKREAIKKFKNEFIYVKWRGL